MMWQIVAYMVITAGEVMVSVTALEFSYTQAPKKMKSLIMGVYLLVAIALGNILTAKVNEYIDAQKKVGTSILEGAQLLLVLRGGDARVGGDLRRLVAVLPRSRYIQGERTVRFCRVASLRGWSLRSYLMRGVVDDGTESRLPLLPSE